MVKNFVGYSTKYCLSVGIQKVSVHRHDPESKYVYTADRYSTQLVIGRDFFEKKEDAIAAARKATDNKIKLLKKQIARLEKFTVNPKWEA